MDSSLKCFVRKAAILGSGVMGAQIAAHFSNAGIPVMLYDLPAKGNNLNELVDKSLQGLTKLKPNPLMDKKNLQLIQSANYDQHLPMLKDCDLIIEAISERLDWKEALYQKISPHLNSNAIIASNTSGLSINHLAEVVPAALRARFCGVHFFNPPRYMSLVELIPADCTDKTMLAQLESFMTTHLGKNIVYAKDTPNFVANRVGVFSMLITLYHAEQFKIPFEVVDALTGPALGRPKSATFRTADVVGLDTFAHTVTTMRNGLPHDPWHARYQLPEWLLGLIERGALGQKSQAGIFKKEGKQILVFDPETKQYRASTRVPAEGIQQILAQRDPVEKFKALRESLLPEARFLWACFRDLFHYCAYHLADIADSVRSVDQAIRWGFGWKLGPFETWQLAGWQQVIQWIEDDVMASQTLAPVPLPEWVKQIPAGPYEATGAYSPQTKMAQPRRTLSVYQRQIYPDPMLAESPDEGTTVFETNAVRLWHAGDDVAVLSFKSKMCAIGSEVLEGIAESVEKAEKAFKGLVVWQRHSEHFSAGANLKEFVGVIKQKNMDALNKTLEQFQQTCLRMRYSSIPTVAAARGYVFGGGCELMMHCDRTVAAAETYMGLVEAGVGLLPAGGGCKEMAMRAANGFLVTEPFQHLETYFKQIAMAEASTSAAEGKAMGYLRPEDTVVMHPLEILYVAKQQINWLASSGYRPPAAAPIKVAGIDGISRIQTLLVNMKAGAMISDHDYEIALTMAEILCGGRVDAGSLVDEQWLLRLEREGFLKLASTEKSLARIEHMLETGKPLRN